MTTPQEPISGPEVYDETDNADELPRLGLLVCRLCAPEGISPAERDLVPAVEIAIDLDSTTNVSSVQGPSEEQLNQELQSRELSSAELLVPAPIVIYDQPLIRRHVSEDCSSLEVAHQRRHVCALRAVVSSVHEDIGASQTRPARVKTSHWMPDCLTCKLNGQALAVMLCEDDSGGSFAFPPGPILRRQWD
jgi:hypothetical protein